MIFGARGVTFTNGRGSFSCPTCGEKKPFLRRKVRRFATLYYVPILPLDVLGDYVECLGCGDSFCLSVLTDEHGASPVLSDSLIEVLQRVLAHLASSDGEVRDSDIATVRAVFCDLTGQPWAEADVRERCQKQRANDRHPLRDLWRLTACLNHRAKQLVVLAACRVASAKGASDAREHQWLDRIADTLELPHPCLSEVVATLQEAN